MAKQTGYIFQDEIRRVSGLNQSGNFKEQSSSGVAKAPSCPGHAEALTGKTAAEQLEVGHGAGVGFSGIFNEPLSLRVKQGVVTTVGVFVDFAVPYAFKSSGTGQPLSETADAGEHIDEFNQAPGSLWTWVLFWAYLIGTPHQKQKQPVTGCTEQDFFTVHNV